MSAKVADLIFVRLADVEDEHVVASVEPGLQFLGANFRHGGSRRSFLSLAAYAAELLVVDQFADGGIGAADWALRVLAQAQFAKAHSQRVHQQQAANQRFARAEDELDDLGRLNHAQQSGKNAEHAAFGARGHQPRRRRFGIETAIARAALGGKDAGLAFEAKDGGVNVGLAGEHARIVHQIAGGKVVGAIGDDVELANDVERIGAAELGLELANVDEGIDGGQFLRGGVEFGTTHVGCGMDDLPLQVGEVHHIEVNQAQRAHAGRGQIQRERRAESAGAHAQHARRLQLLLPLHADLGHDQVARVAQNFVVA